MSRTASVIDDPESAEVEVAKPTADISVGSQLEAIMALLQDQSQRLGALEGKVARQAEQMPTVTAMQHVGKPVRMRSADQIMAETNSDHEGIGQLPIGSNGRLLDANLLRRFGQSFSAGDMVRIRREAVIAHVGERTLTWGDVLDKLHNPGVGTVLRSCFIGNAGEWKYRVKVQGLTAKHGDGFFESDLIGL